MFTKIKSTFKEYPAAFKVLTLATFIDRLGNFLLFPFFALYIIGNLRPNGVTGKRFSVFQDRLNYWEHRRMTDK